MPESPEVQALADELDGRLRGRTLTAVDVLEFRVVKTRSRQPSSLAGGTLNSVTRHGKYLDLQLGDAHLVVSLGRHGWARWGGDTGDAAAPPALAVLDFGGDVRLEFTDAGGWISLAAWVVDSPTEVPAIASLGPDPAGSAYSRADFDAAFGGRRKQLKAVLQEQKSVAGIGNAYSDEILFSARLNPVAQASELSDDDRQRLFEQTVHVIRAAIDARRGIPIAELKATKVAAMLVHGRTGEPCPGCSGVVRDFTFAGTTAQYCPECQTGGAIL